MKNRSIESTKIPTLLGDSFTVETGKSTNKANRLISGQYEIMGANGCIGYTDRYLINKKCILTGRVGTLGEFSLINKKIWPSDNVLVISEKDPTNSIDFLYYYLKTIDFKSLNVGSTQPLITQTDVKNLPIDFPPNNRQLEIAEILSSLDDKIGLNRRINANLEAMASALFEKWFINVENQQIGKVSDLIRVESGFPFHSSMFDKKGDYKLVTIKNVQDGFFIRECTDSLSEIPSKVSTHCKLNNGDILLSLTGNVGRVCFVYGENYLLNQRVAKLEPINENNRAFTYFLFRQKDFQSSLISISRGTAQQNLSPIETKLLEIPIPSQDMLDHFAGVANPIFQKLVKNYNEIKNLSILRDSLLPRLMNGKIGAK